MGLIRGRVLSGGKPVRKGPISKTEMKNGEERVQYHNGKLKVIRKEFGKMFELEFVQAKGPSTDKELKTFAKHSDVKKPARNAIKIFEGGVRAAEGKKFYGQPPASTDSHTSGGEFELTVDGSNVITK